MLQCRHDESVMAVAFHPVDSKLFLSCAWDGKVSAMQVHGAAMLHTCAFLFRVVMFAFEATAQVVGASNVARHHGTHHVMNSLVAAGAHALCRPAACAGMETDAGWA